VQERPAAEFVLVRLMHVGHRDGRNLALMLPAKLKRHVIDGGDVVVPVAAFHQVEAKIEGLLAGEVRAWLPARLRPASRPREMADLDDCTLAVCLLDDLPHLLVGIQILEFREIPFLEPEHGHVAALGRDFHALHDQYLILVLVLEAPDVVGI
jgi:hypothetical protein